MYYIYHNVALNKYFLIQPNRYEPTRIGIVLYQHRKLDQADHGYKKFENKLKDSIERDYQLWKLGDVLNLLSERRITRMIKAGYKDVEIAERTKAVKGNSYFVLFDIH